MAKSVLVDLTRCIGCRYCMVACPFSIPKYEWGSTAPAIQKCTFCVERINDNMLPVCVKTCPTGVMFFNDHDKVVAEAKKRVSGDSTKYINHIFGLNEAGGTNWIYISDKSFDALGFQKNIPNVALASYTWPVLSTIPHKVVGIIAVLSAVAYFRGRGSREEGNS